MCNVFLDVPHAPTQAKLRTEDGRTVRIQETSLAEMLELWHRFCDPKALGLDLCTGTGVSMLAMLHLGLQGNVNDRDSLCVSLGEARARNYMDYLYEENDYQSPPLGKPHYQAHDGTDLYAWIPRQLGLSQQTALKFRQRSTTMILPPNNIPFNLNDKMTDEEWTQVFTAGCLLVLRTVTMDVRVRAQYCHARGLLVNEDPALKASGAKHCRRLQTIRD